MNRLFVALAMATATLLPLKIHAEGRFTVEKLLTLEEKPSTYYIIGVYEGFNMGRLVDKQWTCYAPPHTSNSDVAAMVRKEWHDHPEDYKDVAAESGVGMAICKMWRQRPS